MASCVDGFVGSSVPLLLPAYRVLYFHQWGGRDDTSVLP